MTLLAIAFVTLFMYKFYEVPVHFNKVTIDNLSNHVVTDSSRITISFNYDYNNSRSLRKNRTFDGDDCGIKYNYYLFFEPTDSCLFVNGQSTDSVCLWIKDYLVADQKKRGFDSVCTDNLHNLVRTTISHSSRQLLYPLLWFSSNVLKQDPYYIASCKSVNYKDGIPADSIFAFHSVYFNSKYSGRMRNGVLAERYSMSQDMIYDHYDVSISDYKFPNIIFTGEDISAAIERFSIDMNGIDCKFLKRLAFTYKAPVEVTGLPFEPDMKGMNYIAFTDSLKIARIAEQGLVFHVSFPDMVNVQSVRSIIITALLGMLIGVFFRLIYRISCIRIHTLWRCRSFTEFFKELLSILHILFINPFVVLWNFIMQFCRTPRYMFTTLKRHPAQLVLFFVLILAIVLWLLILDMSTVNALDLDMKDEAQSSRIFNII